MKVLQVLNHFLPQQTAGTEVYTWALSKQLQQKGIDVKVMIPNYGKNDSVDYIYDGLVVHQYAEPSVVDRSLAMGFRQPDGLKNFTRFLKLEQPDIIHFHELAGSNGITLNHVKEAKASGAKVVMTFHLSGYSCKTGTLVYKGKELCDGKINLKKCTYCYLEQKGYSLLAPYLTNASLLLYNNSIDTTKWITKMGTALGSVQIVAKLKSDFEDLISQCDQVIAITEWYQNILIENGVENKKIALIKQGLPKSLSLDAKRVRNQEEPLKLLYLGRVSRYKGLHLLIDAINDIEESKLQLSIYGTADDINYEADLKQRTKNRTNVFWRGGIPQDRVAQTMHENDILCLCSTFSEMSPLVIQEAFHVGIPVIASGVYGNLEQIKHEQNGLIFKFNDVKSLKQQITRLIHEEGLLNKLQSSKNTTFNFRMIAVKYKQLYESILKN